MSFTVFSDASTSAPKSKASFNKASSSSTKGTKALQPKPHKAPYPPLGLHSDNGVCTGRLIIKEAHWLPPIGQEDDVDEPRPLKKQRSSSALKAESSCAPGKGKGSKRLRTLTESPLAEVTEAYTGQGAFRMAQMSPTIVTSPLSGRSHLPPIVPSTDLLEEDLVEEIDEAQEDEATNGGQQKLRPQVLALLKEQERQARRLAKQKQNMAPSLQRPRHADGDDLSSLSGQVRKLRV